MSNAKLEKRSSIFILYFFLSSILSFSVSANAETTTSMPLIFSVDQLTPLNKLAGNRPVLIEFWSTTCAVCKVQIPAIAQMAERFKDTVYFLGMNIDTKFNQKRIEGYIKKYRYPLPWGFDTGRMLARMYSVPGTPTHVLLSPTGVEIDRFHEISPELIAKLESINAIAMVRQ